MIRLPALLTVVALVVPARAFPQTTPSGPRPIVVQGAMPVEIDTLVSRLNEMTIDHVGGWTFWSGKLDGYPVVISKTLKGVSNAAAATAMAVQRYNPAAII